MRMGCNACGKKIKQALRSLNARFFKRRAQQRTWNASPMQSTIDQTQKIPISTSTQPFEPQDHRPPFSLSTHTQIVEENCGPTITKQAVVAQQDQIPQRPVSLSTHAEIMEESFAERYGNFGWCDTRQGFHEPRDETRTGIYHAARNETWGTHRQLRPIYSPEYGFCRPYNAGFPLEREWTIDFPTPARDANRIDSMFSEENPNACCIV
ncbi:hypothetical protein AMTRI_Chr13g84840 [Amborella trichopoda]